MQHQWRRNRARPTRAARTVCAVRRAPWPTARAGHPCTPSRPAAGPSATARPTARLRWRAAPASAVILAQARAALTPFVEQLCIHLFVLVHLVILGIHSFVAC